MSTQRLSPYRDRRLAIYVGCAALGMIATLLSGEAALGAVTAMFITVILLGLRFRSKPTIDVSTELSTTQIIEGDQARLTVRLTHDPAFDIALLPEVPTHVHQKLNIAELRRGSGWIEVELERDFPHFGHQRLGRLVASVSAPGSLMRWNGELADLGDIRVLPRPDRLSELLSPRASQISAGLHNSRSGTGDGTDFAEVRQYQRGDRLRDINWKVTARRGAPHVTKRIPERGGDVVIVIDGLRNEFVNRADIEFRVVERAGQAAWALIRHHMAAQDRVGLVVRSTQRQIFVPPQGGTRAQYALAEALLELTGDRAFLTQREFDPALIPPGALALALTPLLRLDSALPIVRLATSGRAVGTLAVSVSDLFEPKTVGELDLGRLVAQSFEAQVAFLHRTSIPTVVWSPRYDIDRAVRTLGRLTGRRSRRGAA